VLRYPPILSANVTLELVVYGLRLPEDRQVDVHYECRVPRKGFGEVRRGQHELPHSGHDVRAGTLGSQELNGPLGASQLVVTAIGAIDGIVEPECEFYFRGMLSVRADTIQLPKARREMLDRVIVATPPAPRSQKFSMLSIAGAHV